MISCVLSQDKNGGKPSHDRYKMLNTMIKLLGFFFKFLIKRFIVG